MKKTFALASPDTAQIAALGTEAVAAVIANASPYKFEFHTHGATHHHLVIAPTSRGMTEGIIVPSLLAFPKLQRPAKGWRRHVRRLKSHQRAS